jgi:preprotein translocase subunit SecF
VEFFPKPTNFRFMATRKVWYSLSAVLMIACLSAYFTKGLNYAIDFTGGVSAEAAFTDIADLDRVTRALEEAGFNEPSVQNFGSSREVAIRLPPITDGASDEIRRRVEEVLKSIDPQVQMLGFSVVGPQVGEELKVSAIWALTFTLLLIAIYLIFRFHTWRLSVGATLAVMHDPIIVIGVFALTQTPFDLAVVAAILAVVGYSLNDTVVVFDRIRERFESSRRLPPATVLDQAINQTLSRTIMTKVTTLIVVVALLFLGGPALRGFSEALLIGILAGTYSSIYISSAVALDLGLKAEHVFPVVKKTAVDHLP